MNGKLSYHVHLFRSQRLYSLKRKEIPQIYRQPLHTFTPSHPVKPLHLSNRKQVNSLILSLKAIEPRKITKLHFTVESPQKPEKAPNTTLVETEPIDSQKTPESNLPNQSDRLDPRVWIIALSSLLMGTAIGIVVPVMPTFASTIGLNTAQYGSVVAIMGITRLIFNFPAAWIADRFGRKAALVGGPVITSIGMSFTGCASGIRELLFYRVLSASGGSLQMAGGQLYLSDISTPLNRARTISPLMAAFSAGSALGPSIGGVLLEQFGIEKLFFFVGACIAGVCINNYIRLPETKVHDPNNKKRSFLGEVKHATSQWKVLLADKNICAVLLVHGSFWFAMSGCTFTLMPLIATTHLGISATALGFYFTVMSVVNLVGSQSAAYIVDRYGRKKGIIPALGILSCTSLGMMMCQSSTDLFAWVCIWAIGSTLLGSGPTAYLTDITTQENRSQGLALLRSAGDFGLFLGASVLGILAQATSTNVSLSISSFVLLAAGINFAFRARETVRPSKK